MTSKAWISANNFCCVLYPGELYREGKIALLAYGVTASTFNYLLSAGLGSYVHKVPPSLPSVSLGIRSSIGPSRRRPARLGSLISSNLRGPPHAAAAMRQPQHAARQLDAPLPHPSRVAAAVQRIDTSTSATAPRALATALHSRFGAVRDRPQ